jgi:hypothetical protein
LWASGPKPGVDDDLFREPMTFVSWLERWVEGAYLSAALIAEPITRDWGGATDEDWAEWSKRIRRRA